MEEAFLTFNPLKTKCVYFM